MKKASYALSVLLVVIVISVWACPWDESQSNRRYFNWWGKSFIEPNLVKDRNITDEDRQTLNGWDMHPGAFDSEIEKASIAEWIEYFRVTRKMVVTPEEIRTSLRTGQFSFKRLEGNGTAVESNPRDSELRRYFDFWDQQRKIDAGSWNPEESAFDAGLLLDFVSIATNINIDEFIRAKYAFLAVRYATMTRRYETAIDQYQNLFGPLKAEGFTRYRTLGYVARSYVKLGKKDKALSTYLRIFDECIPMRKKVVISLADLGWGKDMFEFARGIEKPHKKLSAYYLGQILLGSDYSKEYLEALVQYGEGENQAEMGLIRALQDLECARGEDLTSTLYGRKSNDPTVYSEIIRVLERSVGKKMVRPALWSFSIAYVSLFAGEVEKAKHYCDIAEGLKSSDEVMRRQLHILRTLIMIAENTTTYPVDLQNRLMEDVNWLETNQGILKNRSLSSDLRHVAAQKYYAVGDRVHGALLANSLNDLTNAELFKLDVLLLRGGSNQLEQFWIKNSSIYRRDIQVVFLRREIDSEKFQEASARLKRVRDPSFKEPRPLPTETYPQAEYYLLNKIYRVYFEKEADIPAGKGRFQQPVNRAWVRTLEGPNIGYADLSFDQYVTYMSRLQKTTLPESGATKISQYRALFEMARAYVSSQYLRSSDCNGSNPYYAQRKFEKVVQLGEDAELSAKALIYLYEIHYPRSEYYPADFKKQTCREEYLSKFKTRYQSTKFYQEYKSRCAALRDVAAPQTRP